MKEKQGPQTVKVCNGCKHFFSEYVIYGGNSNPIEQKCTFNKRKTIRSLFFEYGSGDEDMLCETPKWCPLKKK